MIDRIDAATSSSEPPASYAEVSSGYRRAGYILDDEEEAALIADLQIHDCLIVGTSKGFTSLTGFPRDEALGQNCRMMLKGVPEVAVSKSARKNLRDFCRMCKIKKLDYISEVTSLQPNSRKNGTQFVNFFLVGLVQVGTDRYLLGVQRSVGEGLFVSLNGRMMEEVTEAARETFKRIRQKLLSLDSSLGRLSHVSQRLGFTFFSERLQDHCLLLNGGRTAMRREPQELATNCLVFGNAPVRMTPNGLYFAVRIEDAVTTFEGAVHICRRWLFYVQLHLREDNGAEEAWEEEVWEEEAWEEDDCEEWQEEQAQNEEAAKAEARVGNGVGSSSADTAEEGPDEAEAWQTWTEENRDVRGEQEHQEHGQGWEEGQNEWMEDEEEDVDQEDPEEPCWIDELQDCRSVCDVLLQVDAIAVDVEGVDLGRAGEICIIQVSTRMRQVYLFDITTLGRAAFRSGLKELLESVDVVKLFYDCRSDADALHHLHGVRLANVLDLQVLFTHQSGQRSGQLPGMAKALGQVLSYEEHQEAKGIKAAGTGMFAPEKGGNIQVWKLRPLPQLLVRYCAQDVRHLFAMWAAWDSLSHPELQEISEADAASTASSGHLQVEAAKKWCLGASVLVGACGEAFARDQMEHFRIGFKQPPQTEVASWSTQADVPPHKRRAPVSVNPGDVFGCLYTMEGRLQLWRNGSQVLDFDVGRPIQQGADYYAVIDVCLAAYSVSLLPHSSPSQYSESTVLLQYPGMGCHMRWKIMAVLGRP
ncbi:Exd1 [Symbiodinium sp. CCMP2592]|nr:Exd1 [Symbiodinium sp. CCMP2592]